MTYLTGTELKLIALKKEHKNLSRIAEKAKAECDEYINISSEFFAIHEEFAEIVKSREMGEDVVKKLDKLRKRQDHAEKVLKKDLMTLINKQSDAEINRDHLLGEIYSLEWKLKKK